MKKQKSTPDWATRLNADPVWTANAARGLELATEALRDAEARKADKKSAAIAETIAAATESGLIVF